MTKEEPLYTRHSKTPPSDTLTPPPPTYPTRKWSCLHLDQPDVVDSPSPAVSSPLYSPPDTSPPLQNQDYRAALPVERWAENVNRYYGSQNATGGGMVSGEELSELDSLYQASLLAPSMHRASHGVSPQPGGSKAGKEAQSESKSKQSPLKPGRS